jgi:hypothetical protein
MRARPTATALAASTALALSAALAPAARACPAFLAADGLPSLHRSARANLRLFTLSTRAGQPAWTRQPLQIDPLDEAGVLRAPAPGEDLGKAPLAAADRLSFRNETLGERVAAGAGAPCRTPFVVELRDALHAERFGYLAACDDAGAPLPSPVHHDKQRLAIGSPLFEYVYQPNNQLIFSSLAVSPKAGGARLDAGSGADILLHIDPKGFFTMEFTNDDVQSFVEATNAGELGLVGRIQFYLKLLFLKIDLKMATVASWFSDSANIPMVMDVPADAPKNLHAGSGMLFNWLPRQTRFAADGRSTVPRADGALALQGAAAVAKLGLGACRGDTCRYRQTGAIGDRAFTIDMTVGRELVERGFFPSWVDDVAAFKKAIGWSDEAEPEDKGRIALYFETSGLAKGQYTMDYWIRMGEPESDADTCPRRVDVVRLVPAGDLTPRTSH